MLKTYLQALLSRFYSKKENGAISELSAPNHLKRQRYDFTGNAMPVAPFDGYVCMLYLNGSVQTTWRRLSLWQDAIDTLSTYPTTYWSSGWKRVKKGQTVTCTCGEDQSGKQASYMLFFCSTMGGGLIQSLTRFFGQFKGACYA